MKVGIYGSSNPNLPKKIIDKAKKIGKELAKKGHTVVTGGCSGIPHIVAYSAYKHGGKCIAFSPASNIEEHKNDYASPIEGYSEFVFVPKEFEHFGNKPVCYKYRNVTSIAYVDAAIFIDGKIGTMNEFTNAYDMGKRIGVLEGTGGITTSAIKVLIKEANKEFKSLLIFESDPVKLVTLLLS